MSSPSSETNAVVTAEKRDKLATLPRPGGGMTSALRSEGAPSNDGDRIPVTSTRSSSGGSSINSSIRTQPKTDGPSAETMAALEQELSSMLQELTSSPSAAQAGELRPQTPEIDRFKAEANMWKRKAETAQRSYRMMMSQAQAAEQTRMKQAAELSLLREERMALSRANDAKAEDLLRTREALEETRAELATLKTVLCGRHHPQAPRQPWPFALSPTAPPPTPLLVPYARTPEEHMEAFAAEPTGRSSLPSPRRLIAAGGWGRGPEAVSGAASCPVEKDCRRSPNNQTEAGSSGVHPLHLQDFRSVGANPSRQTDRAGALSTNGAPRMAPERRRSARMVSQQGTSTRTTSRPKSGTKGRGTSRTTSGQNDRGGGGGGAS